MNKEQLLKEAMYYSKVLDETYHLARLDEKIDAKDLKFILEEQLKNFKRVLLNEI